MQTLIPRLSAAAVALLLTVGCGSSAEPEAASTQSTSTESTDAGDATGPASTPTIGIRLISAEDGAAIQNDPPENLVILDVRTAEEFAEGHIEGAVMLDFYRDDFADQLAGLDREVPYLLYCRSGNRSGQTAAMMDQLGFADVADVDGGILSWVNAGLPTVAE